jgi:ABC-type spermidine/putrescine transport system permease subunit II
VVALIVLVPVLVPDIHTGAGLNVTVAPAGCPATWKLTQPLNPLRAVTDTA